MTAPSVPACAPRSSTSPRVAAAQSMSVPASMRSGMGVKRAPCSAGTPSTVSRLCPMPEIFAPMRRSSRARSAISGSLAALSMTVTPLASVAAISRFSVAPTEGTSR